MPGSDTTTEDSTLISSTERPQNDVYLRNEEKSLDEDLGLPARYQGTSEDKKDMSMLGKKQVLRVCAHQRARWMLSKMLRPSLAKLPLRHHGRLCFYRHGQLGDLAPVTLPLARVAAVTDFGLRLFSFVLIDGGTADLFWGFIVVGFGQTLVYASIAEAASM